MTWKRVVLEIGMGTDIRGAEPTKAAVRALRDALWHNSLSIAKALGQDTDSMRVEVTIGIPHPEKVDKAAVLAVLPVPPALPRVMPRVMLPSDLPLSAVILLSDALPIGLLKSPLCCSAVKERRSLLRSAISPLPREVDIRRLPCPPPIPPIPLVTLVTLLTPLAIIVNPNFVNKVIFSFPYDGISRK